jgi:hypothetical protein
MHMDQLAWMCRTACARHSITPTEQIRPVIKGPFKKFNWTPILLSTVISFVKG